MTNAQLLIGIDISIIGCLVLYYLYHRSLRLEKERKQHDPHGAKFQRERQRILSENRRRIPENRIPVPVEDQGERDRSCLVVMVLILLCMGGVFILNLIYLPS